MTGELSPERIAEIRCFRNKFGPGNCWTGSLGAACQIIDELLKERERILGARDDGCDSE